MKTRNLSLRGKLLAGFALPIAGLLAIAATIFVNMASVTEANRWVEHTQKVIEDGQLLLSDMVDMETGLRGFLISGDEQFLEPYHAGDEAFEILIKELKQTVSDNPGQVARLNELHQLKAQWVREHAAPLLQLRREVRLNEAALAHFEQISARTEGKAVFDRLRQEIALLNAEMVRRNDAWGRELLSQLLLALVNQETGQRGFLLSGQEASLEPYDAGQVDFQTVMAQLSAHPGLGGEPELRAGLERAQGLVSEWRAVAAEPEIEARRAMNQVSATMKDVTDFIGKGEGKQRMDAVRQVIADFSAEEQGLIQVRRAEAHALTERTLDVAIWSAVLSILAAAGFGVALTRHLMGQIGSEPEAMAALSRRIADGDLTSLSQVSGTNTGIHGAMADMVEHLSAMVSKISQSARLQTEEAEKLAAIATQTNQNVQVQRGSIDQVVVAIEQMQAAAHEVASSTSVAAESADLARQNAAAGTQQVNETVEEIRQLSVELDCASRDISALSDSAQSISRILDVIKGIAEQTNLLALNAAIEAARAGEQGRGFAVVADEVRALAQNTQDSIADIESVILEVQNGAKQSVDTIGDGRNKVALIVDKTGHMQTSLDDINAAVQSVTEMTTQIASACEEQSATTRELSHRAVEIKELSEQTGTGAEAIAVSTGALSQSASQLSSEVARFRVV